MGIDEDIKSQKYKNINKNIDIDKISKEITEIYKKKRSPQYVHVIQKLIDF